MTFRVQTRRCATCIYRRDSVLDLAVLEAEVADGHGFFSTYRACHHARDGGVCCRGFWDLHRDEFQAGQVAQRLGVVEFVLVDDLPELVPNGAITWGKTNPARRRERSLPLGAADPEIARRHLSLGDFQRWATSKQAGRPVRRVRLVGQGVVQTLRRAQTVVLSKSYCGRSGIGVASCLQRKGRDLGSRPSRKELGGSSRPTITRSNEGTTLI